MVTDKVITRQTDLESNKSSGDEYFPLLFFYPQYKKYIEIIFEERR